MVTLRYRKQQAEEEARKQRLVAARQAASSLALQQARQYSVQKTNQAAQVRRELQTRWALEQQDKAMAVADLLHHAQTHRAEGLAEAARRNHALVGSAEEEVSAWAAEHELEHARFRLATAYVQADALTRNATAVDAAERRAKVRETERARAAQVAAAPRTAPATLAEACAGMERFDQQPVHGTPFKTIRVNIPRDKRMSGVAHPPRCVPGEHYRSHPSVDPETIPSATDAAAQLLRQREHDQAAEVERIRQAQATASERAERGLRERREAAARSQQSDDEARARRREVAEVYRHPREDEANGNDRTYGSDPRDAAAAAFPATHRQRAQEVARDAEEAFVRDFVEGPPVLVPGVPPQRFLLEEGALPSPPGGAACGHRRGIPVEVLLRPARVQDLLPDAAAQTTLAAVPMPAEPLIISVFTSDTRTTPRQSQSQPQASVAPVTAAEAPPPTTEPTAPAAPEQNDRTISDTNATGAASPVDHEEPTAAATTATMAAAAPAVATVVEPPFCESAASQPDDADGVEVVEVSRVTAPESLSTSTNTSAADDAHRSDYSSSEASEPTWVRGESDITSCTEATSQDDDTTFTSTSSASMRPTMTAEQLKLALIRLRNRMRTAQM